MLAQALTILAAAAALVASAMPQASGSSAVPPPPTVADPMRGLDLWRGAKVGMSMSAVQRGFPLAIAPTKPTVLTGGQIDRLQLGPVDLYGHPAIVHFYFLGAELSSVEMTAGDFRPGQTTRNMTTSMAIAAAYSAVYGKGYDCGARSLGDVNVYECKWLKGPLAIQLWYMDVAGQAPLFYVAYKQADNPSYSL